MPVPDQVRDDGSGIQIVMELPDVGLRHNDKPWENAAFYERIRFRGLRFQGETIACRRLARP